ncbi:MAG: polyprenyl synthetase family protein [Nitratireductor sp.]|nr:polyprenyl synthetase family protein [Nitratireductor sp.]
MTAFETRLSEIAALTGEGLAARLCDAVGAGEAARPPRLLAAMRHGALNGGKRLRPFLLIESAGLFGTPQDEALPAALALECIHCYSLIHDDLPAMDDDDLRRGKPTVHKAYDEATAILAGDGLLTLAFDILAGADTHGDAAIRCELIAALSGAAGIGGMVGGQMFDLEAETIAPDPGRIRLLQSMKTGALIRFACEAGAILAGADSAERLRLRRFGELSGAAFQLADDILDVTASGDVMGKRTGKDAGRGKGTLVQSIGLEQARAEADRLAEEAIALLAPYGEKSAMLADCARFIVSRGN